MSDITLSIVTATYNNPSDLLRTFVSLHPLRLSCVSWEHIIVDSSPEVTQPVIDRLDKQSWPLRRVIEQPKGVYAAFNRGIEVARGRLVWFLNSGDVLLDALLLERVCRELEKDKSVELALCGARLYRDGRYLYPMLPKPMLEANILGRNRLCHQGVVYKREVFGKAGVFDMRYTVAADYEHYLRCYLNAIKTRTFPYTLIACGMDGLSNREWRRSMGELVQISSSLKGQIDRRHYFVQRVRTQLEVVRVYMMKFLGRLPVLRGLKPVYYGINRHLAHFSQRMDHKTLYIPSIAARPR